MFIHFLQYNNILNRFTIIVKTENQLCEVHCQ